MKEKVSRGIIYGLLLLVMSFFLYIATSVWYNNKIYFPDLKVSKKLEFSAENLKENAKDFEMQNDGTFISTSGDPWFTIETTENIKTIVINIKAINDAGNTQIFYYGQNDGLETERSISCKLRVGKNYIQLPDVETSKLRLDLTDREDTTLVIESVTLFNARRIQPFLCMIIFLEIIICGGILYLWIYEKDRLRQIKHWMMKKVGSECKFFLLMLLVVIGVSIIIVYGKIIVSGNQYVYYDIGGGDEPEAYIPLFVSYINQIKSGTLSSWTFFNGLGTSTTAVFGFLLNPFLLLVFLSGILFGISTMNTMLLVAQMLNIVVCGVLCYKYLDNFKGSYFSKAVASYICAFNGYMILYAQHYVHSDFCFYLLVILILIEKILKNRKITTVNLYFALCCAALFLASIYIGYMIGIFAGIYVIFRVLQEYRKNEIALAFNNILQIIIFAVLGVMLAMPVVIPTANELLFNSTRITGDDVGFLTKIKTFLLTPYPLKADKTIFLRMLSNNLESTGNNFWGITGNSVNDYYAAPTLFFSIFIIVFITIYYVTLAKRVKGKFQCVLRIVAGILVAFLMFNQLGSAMFNAFVATFGRYSYLLMPIFAIVSMTALDEMRKLRKLESVFYVLSTFCTFGLVVIIYYLKRANGNVYYKLFLELELIITLGALVVALLSYKYKRKYCVLVFSLLIFVNVTMDSYITVNDRVFCEFSRDLIDEDDYATMDALKHVEQIDTSMYRLEKNYYDLIYYHDAYFEKYHGISTYNSTLNGNIKEFYRMYCNPAINFYSADSFWYSFLNVSNDITQNSLMGIRYILSNGTAYPNDKYSLVYTNGNVKVYQNEEAKSFGIFYEHVMKKSQVQELGMNDREKVLSYAVVLEDKDIDEKSSMQVSIEDVLRGLHQEDAGIEIKNYKENRSDNSVTEMTLAFTEAIPDDQKTYYLELQSDLDYMNNIMVYFDEDTKAGNLTPYYHRGTTDGSLSEMRILLPSGTKNITLKSSKVDVNIQNIKILSVDAPIVPHEADITVDLIKNNYLKGTVKCETEGYLFLPVPFEKGWSAVADGQEVQILKADSGFMAIKLGKGSHSFELKYHYPGATIGCIFSALSIMVLGIIFLHQKKFKKVI